MPHADLYLLRSGDSTARIWNTNPSSPEYSRSVVLHHEVKADKSKDVTTLDWNQDGTLLATGSYDGLARIWSKEGEPLG
jgi:transducin (beta)-like 1